MGNKRKKAAVSIKPDKIKEIMETPDDSTFFKMIVDLDNEVIEVITIPFGLIKEKLKNKNGK